MRIKKRKIYPFLFTMIFWVISCSPEPSSNKEIIAKINGYELTLEEFEEQLVSDLNFEEDYKLTRQAKEALLEQLIRKELLIQEATKLELNRKEKFIKAIERYWEATLIKDLMELKGKEFAQRTYVSQEEIEAYYKDIKKKRPDIASLEKVRDDIYRELAERKKYKKLEEWMAQLRENSDIYINEEVLNKN